MLECLFKSDSEWEKTSTGKEHSSKSAGKVCPARRRSEYCMMGEQATHIIFPKSNARPLHISAMQSIHN